jgi:transcriptional regulator with AAA-type ATPase domain
MKNIYITFHYTTHGIAYLKHILSAFYAKKCHPTDKTILAEKLSQFEMNEVFDKGNKGFLFDEIYYLTAPQESFDRLSARRFNYRYLIETDDHVIKYKTNDIWTAVISEELGSLEEEINFVKQNFPNRDKLFMSQIWRDIQHYAISDQLFWFKNYSNAPASLLNRFKVREFPIENLRDPKEISKYLIEFIRELNSQSNEIRPIINVALGSNETQVAWQVLANANMLPEASKLIYTYDDKTDSINKRFKNFDIKEVSKKIISEIASEINIYDSPKSKVRQLADVKMQTYLKAGFSILLLGERGIGKTRLAEKYKEKNQIFVAVNCASFTDNTLAESILFGYKKGAFTGAGEDRPGIFEQADGGILFFDEIHSLDKITQARLMKAIETDRNNKFTIKRIGDDKEHKAEARLIFASNRSIDELREVLLPDFFDRITQLVIELPSLRESDYDLYADFKAIWHQLRFDEFYAYDEYSGRDKALLDWIKLLDLYGNYRDLQKIAIYYKVYLDFDEKEKKMLPEKSAFEYTKNQFERYISFNSKKRNGFIDFSRSPDENIKLFKKRLSERLIEKFGSAKKVVNHYKKNGHSITDKTLYNWKGVKKS